MSSIITVLGIFIVIWLCYILKRISELNNKLKKNIADIEKLKLKLKILNGNIESSVNKKNKSLKNLRSHMSLEQRKVMSRKGGIMSGVSRRRKKALADRIKLALEISTTERENFLNTDERIKNIFLEIGKKIKGKKQ